jgi:drug/metabolite transporter (DMT)-like permease
MSAQKKAVLCALGAVLLWSTVASAFKLSLEHLAPVQLLLYAELASLFVLGCVLQFQGKLSLLRSCTRKDLLLSAVFGFLNPFFYYMVLFEAYDLLPAQEAQPLNYTWAVTLTLLAVPLLKQKIRAKDILALLVSYAGVFVISTRGDVLSFRFSDPLGVGLALGSTIIWALYWIFNTKDKRDPVLGLFLNFLFALPWTIIACLTLSSLLPTSLYGILGAVYVGFFEMGIAFVLWLTAMKNTDNTAAVGSLIFLSPFLSLFFINQFVGEAILPSTYVGLVLIMGGLALRNIKGPKAVG